jgi:hypothetical protein
VACITSQLTAKRRVEGIPVRLPQNIGKMQKGAFLLGSGFVLDPAEAEQLISDDPRNHTVITPFLGGEDVNSNPDSTPSRFVINFRDWPEGEAAKYRKPFARIKDQVLPIRAVDKIKSRRELWWQFAVRASGILDSVDEVGAAVCVTVVSKYGMPVRVASGAVISSAVAICADSTFSRLVEMSSVAHNAWAWEWGSTMKSDLRYNPSDVFDTFPFIGPDMDLEELGREFDGFRRGLMHARGLGITKLYNQFNDRSAKHDADMLRLRSFHEEIDKLIMDKYGWGDIELEYDFHSYPNGDRWTISPSARMEVLDRLLEENHRRTAGGETREPARVKGKKRKWLADGEGGLF